MKSLIPELFALPVLLLLSCGWPEPPDLVGTDLPFLLAEGDRVKVLNTGLVIEAVTVTDGLEGSHEPGAGSVDLLVDHGIEEDIRVRLETGSWKTLGEYELHFIEAAVDAEGAVRARLLVR